VLAIVMLVTIGFVVLNIIVDVFYALIDPRGREA
jgi:ABC-type dipeptide/oligopeptide/nickel transport system permease component